MTATLVSLAALTALLPAGPLARVAPRAPVLRMQAADDDALDLEAMAQLRQRIARIQQGGLATSAQAYFEIATEKSPQLLLREFFMTTEPRVQQAMQDAVVSLLGTLPPLQFDSRVSTTGDKLVALMLQLQMTGYMLRNAEYVTKLRELLDIRTRSVSEFREAFDRLDEDGSGYLEMGEVKSLIDSFYGGSGEAPPYEAEALMRLLDTNRDGRISWDEFSAALGAKNDSARDFPLRALSAAVEGNAVGAPNVTGTITVSLEGGKEVEVDAASYMEQLKAEAEVLRKELNMVKKQEARAELATTSSLSSYVATLPEEQLRLLTSDMSPEVKEAMQMVVKYIFKVPEDDGTERDLAADDQVTIEQNKMRQLCMYQLVLGYRMREAEAKGEADERLGR